MARASVGSSPLAGVRQAGDRSSGVAKATVRRNVAPIRCPPVTVSLEATTVPPGGKEDAAGVRCGGIAVVGVAGLADPADEAEQEADGRCGYSLDVDRVVADVGLVGDLPLESNRLLAGGEAWAVLLVRCSCAGDQRHGLSGSCSEQWRGAARAVAEATAVRCRNSASTDAPYERCKPTD